MSDSSEPRIPPLAKSEWTNEARDVFAYWEGREAHDNGSWSNTMMTLAQHPALGLASLDFARHILTRSLLAPRQRELIVLRVAWRYNSTYQWTHHVRTAHRCGMTDSEIAALKTASASFAWSIEDAAIIDAVDQLCSAGRIGDPTWRTLTKSLDRQQMMDLVYAAGFFAMNAWALNSMGVQVEESYL